jgi:multiple sugar transport system substrate-binding protein
VSRRTVLKGIGASALLATAAACGGGASTSGGRAGTVKIFNFGNADEGRVYDAVFAKFAAGHGNVRINHTNVPAPSWADYVTKLATQTAGGNPPDLVNLAIEGTQLAVNRKLLDPLDPFLGSSPVKSLMSAMPKALLDAFTVDGKLYQLPTGWQTMAIFYNPKIFAAAGVPEPHPDWTWDEFLQTAKALTRGKVMGFGLPWGFFQLHPWWLSNNTKAVTADMSAPNLTDPLGSWRPSRSSATWFSDTRSRRTRPASMSIRSSRPAATR